MNKEHLNEENFQRIKKRLIIIAVLVIMIGIVGGGYSIYNGIQIRKKIVDEHEKAPTEEEYDSQISALEKEKREVDNKQNEEWRSNGFTDYYYELKDESKELREDIQKLESEKRVYHNDSFDYLRHSIGMSNSTPFIIFGAFGIIASFMIGGRLFVVAFKRKIAAFGFQQGMPIAKEGMEKMAPSLAKVVKEVKKSWKDE